MKRIILPALFAFGLSGSLALAQQQNQPAPPPAQDTQSSAPMHHHRPANAQREAAHLSKQLGLSPDQQSKIEPIFATRDDQIAALKTNTQIGPDDRAHQLRAIHKDADRQLAGILTPAQMEQFKTTRKEHHHKGAPGEAAPEAGGSQPAPPPSA